MSKQHAIEIDGELWYSAQQVAEKFAVSTETVRTWIAKEKVKATKMGAHWRIRRGDMLAWANIYFNLEGEFDTPPVE